MTVLRSMLRNSPDILTHRYEVKPNRNEAIAERMDITRKTIRKLLDNELIQRTQPGRVWDKSNSDISELEPSPAVQGGTSRDYTISRLKATGFPHLAEQVINGEISAAEARRQAGDDQRERRRHDRRERGTQQTLHRAHLTQNVAGQYRAVRRNARPDFAVSHPTAAVTRSGGAVAVEDKALPMGCPDSWIIAPHP